MKHKPSSLPGQIATLIVQAPAQSMHPNFFEKLDQQLRRRGFRIVLQQGNIHIDRVEEPSDG